MGVGHTHMSKYNTHQTALQKAKGFRSSSQVDTRPADQSTSGLGQWVLSFVFGKGLTRYLELTMETKTGLDLAAITMASLCLPRVRVTAVSCEL